KLEQKFIISIQTMFAVSKLNRQHEQTWINLQRRLNNVQFPYKDLFQSDFIVKKAISVGSCEWYFVPSLSTTTSYILACNHIQVDATTHKQPMNLFTIFVGYPGTGKSSAIQHTAQIPLDFIELTSSIMSKTTLVKNLSTNKKDILLSSEIFDIRVQAVKVRR
ncbi:hypothetical protein QZH41_016316, partial [Actinostola sp. cb2023]